MQLDIRRLHRKNLLQTGRLFGWHWNYDGEPCGSISLYTRANSLELSYTRRPDSEHPQHMRYDVPLEYTPCRYGGSRPWFRCPWCGRRCAVLYGLSRDGYFGCRICLRLGYASEAEDRSGRLWRKQRKLEARLGENHERPVGMRQRTYDRICAKIASVEEARDEDFIFCAMKLLRRTGMSWDELMK